MFENDIARQGLEPLATVEVLPSLSPEQTVGAPSAADVASADVAPAAARPPIRGTTGDDAVSGSRGSDLLYGGDGTDTLSGGVGRDSLYGGNDDDTVFGNDGDDLIYGGQGDDLLVGDSFESEQVEPGYDEGRDTIYGGAGDDSIFGLLDDDLLFGGAGHDVFSGGTGDDVVYGGAGNDVAQISNGDDSLYGGTGNDVLIDGLGADAYFGGAGADTFVYLIIDDVDRDEGGPTTQYGVGDDRIADFDLTDRDKAVFLIDFLPAVVTAVVDDGTDTAIVLSHGEVVTLQGFSGQDFQNGLRFASVEDINALSQQRFGYEAVFVNDFNAVSDFG